MAAPPVPSNSNNWPKGWISRPNSPHNCVLIFYTCTPKSTKAATLHPSTTTVVSLACPTNHATGSGFRNGIGVIPFHPLCLTALSWVSFGLGLQRECFELTVHDLREVWPHSLRSPLPCLTALQELHTLWPYGPTPDTWSIAGHPVYHPVHWSVYFDSPYVGIQHWFYWQQRSCQRRFGPGQSDHCGSLGGQKCSCLSSPMTPVPWATGGTGRATTLLCPSQGGHLPRYLVPQLFWARGHLCRSS